MPEYAPLDIYPVQYGGFGFPGSSVVTTDDKSVPDKPVKAADPAPRPTAIGYGGMGGMGGLDGLAGMGELMGCGQHPGFGQFPTLFSDATAWLMRHYPQVVLVGKLLTTPVVSATNIVEVGWDGGQPDMAAEVKAAAEADLLPFCRLAKPGGMESLYFGRWLMELVWTRDVDSGRTLPTDCPSILPMEGRIYVDRFRRFCGYDIAGAYRDARYGLLIVHDRHIDPVLGHSPFQAAMNSWYRAVRSTLNADRVESKAAGIQVIAYYAQNLVGTDGKPLDVKKLVREQMGGVKQGQSAAFPAWSFDKDDIKDNPELGAVPFIKLDRWDWGNIGPNLEAHTNRQRILNVEILSAVGVPERALMASEHGSRADAEAHGDVASQLSYQLNQSFFDQFNPQVTVRWQRANFPKFKGSVRLAPIVADPLVDYCQKITMTRIQATATDPAVDSNVDWRAVIVRSGLPVLSLDDAKTKQAELEAAIAKKQAAGNGKPDPAADPAAKPAAPDAAAKEPT